MQRELRRDPLTGERVLLAPDAPPRQIASGKPADIPDDECPFCAGQEGETPPTIAALALGGKSTWSARCFAHRTPLVRLEEARGGRAHGPWDREGAFGVHEVLVESPEHAGPLHVQDASRSEVALRLVRNRVRDLGRDERLSGACWWRDIGAAAGALQPHPHAQLIASGTPMPRAQAMVTRCADHMRQRGRPLMQDILDTARESGLRVVRDEGGIVVLAPFAPRGPWEFWLVPDAQQHSLGQADDALISSLARAQVALLRTLDAILGFPAMRCTMQSFDASSGPDGCRWFMTVHPIVTAPAGLADCTGVSVIGISPEECAAAVRRHTATSVVP